MKMTGKCLSLLLTLCLLLSLLPVTAQAEWSGAGDGTSETPYQIGTKAELERFRDIVNGANGETQNSSACAVLTADIDLNNEAWTPIGDNYNNQYTGTFDGDGHTVSGLHVSGTEYAGLFGNVRPGAVVRNLGVSGTVIGSNHSTSLNVYAGGVVGFAEHSANVTNCCHTGSVTAEASSSGGAKVGGVVGNIDGSTAAYCCHSAGELSAVNNNSSGKAYVGGVAGYISIGDSPAANCYYLAGSAQKEIGNDSGSGSTAALSADDFKKQASFPGWNFDTVWYMGDDAPRLRAFIKKVSTWKELQAALSAGGDIVLTADVTPDNPLWADALTVPSGVTAALDLNGHIVDRGYGAYSENDYRYDGSAIKISGTLTLTDSDPDANHDGIAVGYTDPITGNYVEVKGGIITGGWMDQYGGGVQIQGGTFNMQGGSITGNRAGKNGFGTVDGLGGGVYMQSGTFNMSGGAVVGNRAVNKNIMVSDMQGKGGGVYVSDGTFTLSGGTVSGNEAGRCGGGVYLASTYSGHSGSLVSGGATVTGNAVGGADSNVYLEGGGVLTFTDTLTGTLGVTMQTPGTFTSGLSGKGTKENFTSDNAAYGVALSGTEATLLPCQATPEAVFTATGPDTGTLSNVAAGMTYAIDSGAATAITDTTVDLIDLAPCTITVIRPGNGITTLDSEAQTIKVTKADAPDGVTAEGCTTANNNDGKLVGVTPAMEYIKPDADTWTSGTGDDVTGLVPGSYLVRVKASDLVLASETQEIEITAYSAPSSGGGSTRYAVIPPAEVEHAEVTVSPQSASRGAAVTITVTPDEGYKVDSVTVTDSKGKEIEVTDNGDGTYSFKMPASKVTVTPVVVEIEDEPVPLANRPFVDVPEGSWFYDAVYHCFDNGYFQGVDGTHFDPQGIMTRAMFATVLYRMAGEREVTGENPFTDVDADTWYTNAVIWAAGEGIIGGYGNGIFGTNDPVTREQMVTIIWRYNGRPNPENADFSGFIDADAISAWAQDAFAWAVETGVISGKGDGVLDPKGTATRAEVAQIVMNYDTLV